MDMAKCGKIIKVCSLVAQMPSGGGWVKSAFISQWSSVAAATTYRYLPRLVDMGYLEECCEDYRSNAKISHYKVTQQGNDYLKSFKEMF